MIKMKYGTQGDTDACKHEGQTDKDDEEQRA